MHDDPVLIDGRWIFSDGTSVPNVSGGTGPIVPAEPAGGGAPTEPVASPPAADPVDPPPAPAPAVEPSLDDAEAAMRARLLGQEPPEGIVPDGAAYRDVVPIREQITALRQQYGGMADAFGGLADEDRTALLEAVPTMGSDLAFAAQAFGGLQAEDRQVLLSIVAMIPEDPEGAAELMAEAATILRGGDPAPAPGVPAVDDPEVDDEDDLLSALGFERDDPNRPITRADFDRMLEERDNSRELARIQQEQVDTMLRTARDLGYDPEANPNTPDGRTARARAGLLFNLARGYGANDPAALQKADADIKAMDQRTIDQYVEGLKSNGGRPQPPAGGAPPSDGRVLESLDDGEAAMRERLARRSSPTA